MVFNEVLIALHLHRAVAADVLVPIARMGIIEDIDRQVEDAVVESRIGQNRLVHRPFRKLSVEILRRDEVVGVQVALSDGEHVQQHQCGDCGSCGISSVTYIGIISGNVFRLAVRPQNQDIREDDKPE